MDRLKKRPQFQRVAKGVRAETDAFVLQAQAGDPAERPARVGFTVTKKTGKAVERNRMRRRLRAAVAEASGHFRPGHDYVLVARRSALSAPFPVLVADVARTLPGLHARLDRKRGRRAGRGPATENTPGSASPLSGDSHAGHRI